MLNTEKVHLTYVHPMTGKYMHSELTTVEAVLLTVKALRRLFKKNYRLTLSRDYFSYSFYTDREGWTQANA